MNYMEIHTGEIYTKKDIIDNLRYYKKEMSLKTPIKMLYDRAMNEFCHVKKTRDGWKPKN